MLDLYLKDVSYLTCDLLTGKSLPVLAAIALVPLDPSLLGTMVLLGVALGSIVTLAYAWSPPMPGSLTWGTRFLNLFFSAFLSVSFAMYVARASGAGAAWMIPAFCVVMQTVPERPTTVVVLGTVSLALFYLSVFETAAEATRASRAHTAEARRLLAFEPGEVRDVASSLGASLLVLVLTVYASICHGPVNSVSAQTQRYTSLEFLLNRPYGIAVCVSAGLTRAYTYLATAYFQDHALHLMLDGSGRRPEFWTAWLYQSTLIYSAAWACTQFTEQILTVFQADRTDLRARVLVLIFALAYWHQWRAPVVFWATAAMTVVTFGALGLAGVLRENRPSARVLQ